MEKQIKNVYSYVPAENLGLFSAPRPIWPDFTPLSLVGDKYTLRLLKENRQEFKNYSEFWVKSYPELYGGMLNFILFPENYSQIFGHGKNFMKNSFAAFVFEDNVEKKIFGGAFLLMDFPNRTAQGVIMSVLPEYRKKIATGKFLYEFIKNYDKFVENSGVEYAWVGAATTHTTTQTLLKHIDYKVRGIIPGMSISAKDKIYYRRDNYVYMDKFYNQGNKKISEKMKLIPEARSLWEVMNRERPE